MCECVREKSYRDNPPPPGRQRQDARPRLMDDRHGKRGRAEAAALGCNEVNGPRVRRRRVSTAATLALRPAAANGAELCRAFAR